MISGRCCDFKSTKNGDIYEIASNSLKTATGLALLNELRARREKENELKEMAEPNKNFIKDFEMENNM